MLKSANRFSRNVRWQFITNGAQAVLGGIYLLVLGRFLGATNFGIFSVVSALISVAGLLLEMRMQDVVAKDLCHIDGGAPGTTSEGMKLIDLFILESVGRILPCIVLIVFSTSLVKASHLPAHASVLIVLASIGFVLSKSGTGVSVGVLRVLGRTDLMAACLVADWGLRLMVTLLVSVWSGLNVQSALWIAVIVGGFVNILQILLAGRAFGYRTLSTSVRGWTWSQALLRLRNNKHLIASNWGISVSDLMAKDLDITMVASFLVADQVGLYKMAKSFVQVIWRCIDPFYFAIMPEIQKLWAQQKDAALLSLLRKTSYRLLGFSFILVLLGTGLVALLGEKILGAGYVGLPSLMLLMSGWVIVCAPIIWGHPLAVAINHPELAVGGSLLGLVLGLCAFLVLTPLYGLNGAAFAWVLTLLASVGFTAGSATYMAVRKRPGMVRFGRLSTLP